MPSRNSTPSSPLSVQRVPIQKTPTNTALSTSSGCRRKPAGLISRPMRSSRPSGSWLTMRWMLSKETTLRLRVCCRRTMPAGLDKLRLGQLIDLVSNILVGDAESRSKDVLGRVYEYFLSQFASAEGRRAASSTHPVAWSSSWSR